MFYLNRFPPVESLNLHSSDSVNLRSITPIRETTEIHRAGFCLPTSKTTICIRDCREVIKFLLCSRSIDSSKWWSAISSRPTEPPAHQSAGFTEKTVNEGSSISIIGRVSDTKRTWKLKLPDLLLQLHSLTNASLSLSYSRIITTSLKTLHTSKRKVKIFPNRTQNCCLTDWLNGWLINLTDSLNVKLGQSKATVTSLFPDEVRWYIKYKTLTFKAS